MRPAVVALVALSSLLASVDLAPPAAAAPTHGWDSSATLLEHEDAVNASKPHVASNGSGVEFDVWMQFDGNRNSIWAIPYFPTTGWGTRALLESSTQDAADPRVAVDETGSAMAVWSQSDGTRYNIITNRFQAGAWLGANTISTTDAGSSTAPQIDVQANGNAMVVWQKHDGTRWNIWGRYYVAGSGWDASATIDSTSNDATGPAVTVDDGGNATAVWQQWNSSSSSTDVWASRYSGAAWGTPVALDNGSGNATRPRIAAAAGGNATAVWQQQNGSTADIWGCSYVGGTGWSSPVLLEADDTGEALSPELGADSSGNVEVVFQQWNNTSLSYDVRANRFAAGSGWGNASALENDSANATAPKVTVDSGGNFTAVWLQANGSSQGVWASRFESGSWAAPALIESVGGSAGQIEAAADAAGNATAVWQSANASLNTAWRNRYTRGIGWGSAALIPTSGGDIAWPQIAVNPSGVAFAVWARSDGTRNSIWANRYVPGSGWESAVLVETNDTGWNEAMLPQVVVDRGGNATVVWQQFDSTSWNVWANRYTQGSGWGSPRLVETDSPGHANRPALAIDDSGRVVVVWAYCNSACTTSALMATRFVPGSGWETPSQISTGGYDSNPDVGVDASGNAIAVWDCGGGCGIYGNRYVPGTGWGSEFGIATQCSGCGDSHFDPRVDVHPNGNATVVWKGAYQSGDTKRIEGRAYAPSTGFAGVVDIDTSTSYDRGLPQVSVDAQGRAIAVWYQSNGTAYHIWANRYTAAAGWGTAAIIDSVTEGDAYNPSVGIDDGGNATVVFHTYANGRYNVSTVRYDAASGWGNQSLLQADATGAVVAVEPSGNATALFHGNDATRWNAWAVRFLAPVSPSAPQGLAASASGTQVALNWTAPDDNGGLNITRYNIYRGLGPNNTTLLGNTTNLTFNDTNLSKGQTYFYRVSGVNAVGDGPRSNATSAMIPRTLPTAPRNLSAAVGYATVLLNWTVPADLGDLALTGYNIYRGTSSGATVFFTTSSGLALNFTDTNLTNGQAYFYRVSAVNVFGEGLQAAEINATPGAAPTAPTGLTVAFGNRSAALNWSLPADLGGFNVTTFRLYRGTSPNASVNFQNVSGDVFVFNDTNLTNGQPYYYSVLAVNSFGNGTRTSEAAVTPMTVPTAAQSLTVGYGDGELYLNWSAPADPGGTPVTGYNLYRGTAPGTESFMASLGNVSSFTNSSLTNGQAYFYYVRALNTVGEGPPSAEANNTPKRAPSAPPNLTATFGDRTAFLNWSAPADVGGAALLRYEVYRATSSGAEVFLANTTASATTYTDTGLTNGQTYFYKVRAVNVVGAGPLSGEVSITPYSTPTGPALAAPGYGDSAAYLTWTAPADNGGTPITGYRVFRSTSPNPTSVIANLSGSNLTFTDNNVTNGVLYYYRVAAVNFVGQGNYSNEVSVTPRTRPSAPAGLNTVAFGDRWLNISWNAPGDGGAALQTYTVYRWNATANGSFVITFLRVWFNDSGLWNGETYNYSVSAINSEGEGPRSANYTDGPRRAPDPATTLTTNFGDQGVTVNWTLPATDGGRPLLEMRIEWSSDNVSWPSNASLTLAQTTTTVSPLTNGQRYYFRIFARNAVGTTWSAVANETPARPPTAPSIFNTTFGDGSVTLRWTTLDYNTSAANGGRSVTNLSVEWATNNTTWFDRNATAHLGAAATTVTIPGLANGRTYWFRVRVETLAGCTFSAEATDSPGRTPLTPAITSTGFGSGSVTVYWASFNASSPAVNGGRTPVTFKVEWTTNASSWLPQDNLTADVNATSLLVPSLTNGALYYFRLNMTNGVGYNLSAVATQIPARAPFPPALQPPTFGDGNVTLSWAPFNNSDPAANGGHPVTLFRVEWTTSQSNWQPVDRQVIDVNDTSVTVSSLANGTLYYFRLYMESDAGFNLSSVASERPARAPFAPAIASTTFGDGTATVFWAAFNASDPVLNGGRDLVSFSVEWTTNNATWIPQGSQAIPFVAAQATVSGLGNGTRYWFRLNMTNAVGSNRSREANETPARAPFSPSIIGTTFGDRNVTVTWSALNYTSAAFNGGRPVVNLSLEWSTDNVSWLPLNWTNNLGPNATNRTVTGLVNGQTYWFRVRVANIAGSTVSAEAIEVPARPPNAPAITRADYGDASVTLLWAALDYTDVALNGGRNVTRLVVEWSTNGTTWSNISASTDLLNTTLSYTVTPLSNGTQYWFRVRAFSLAGNSSSLAVNQTPKRAPDAPDAVSLTPGDRFIEVRWAAPYDGGAAILNYSVYRFNATSGGWDNLTNASALFFNDTGLANGTVYTYSVRAWNEAGGGARSANASEAPKRTPLEPLGVSTRFGDGNITVLWSPPSYDGSAPILSYTVFGGLCSDPEPFPALNVSSDGGARSFTDAGRQNGVHYCYRVTANNSMGESAPSLRVEDFPCKPPSAPHLLDFDYGAGWVLVSWTPDADNGSADIDEFVVYRDGTPLIPHPRESPFNDSTAITGQTYAYSVRAHNRAGPGAYSSPSSVRPITVPTEPLQVHFVPTDGTVMLSWSEPAYNGSSPITGYEVYRSGSATGSQDRRDNGNLTALTFRDTGANGQPYYYVIYARNARGLGPPANVTATPENQPPSLIGEPPSSVRIGRETTFQFQAFDPEGASVTFFKVPTPQAAWVFIDPASGVMRINATPDTVTHRWYNYTIRLTDRGGAVNETTFQVYVGNAAPEIFDIPRDAKPGMPYSADLIVSDADGQHLTVTVSNSNFSMHEAGQKWTLEFTPPPSSGPEVSVDYLETLTVWATDGIDTTRRDFAIRVRNPPDRAPEIRSTFGVVSGYFGDTVVIDVSSAAFTYDPDDPAENLTWRFAPDPGANATLTYDPVNRTFTVKFLKPGDPTLTLTLIDPSGLEASRPLTIESLGVRPAPAVLGGAALWGSFLLVGLATAGAALLVVRREVKAQAVPAYQRLITKAGREITEASRSFRLSGALIATGSVLLLIEQLMLGLADASLAQGLNAYGTPTQPALLAYLDQLSAATILDVVGATVLGFGLVLFGIGVRSLRWKSRRSGESGAVSPFASYAATAAGLLCIAWAALTTMWRSSFTGSATGDWSRALRGSLANPAEGSVTASPDLAPLAAALAANAGLWAIASAVFAAAAVFFWLSGRAVERSAGIRVSGRPLVTTAVMSLVGTILLAFYGVAAAAAAARTAQGQPSFEAWLGAAFLPLAVGGGAKLVAAPIIGAACFGFTALAGARIALARPGRVYLSQAEENAVERRLDQQERAAAAPILTPVEGAAGRPVAAAAAALSAASPPLAAAAPRGPTYMVETVFLLYGDGRAIFSHSGAAGEGMDDPELVGSMLIAVQDFVKDSFKRPSPLDRMSYGDGSVLIERGAHLILALTIFGEPDSELRESMRDALSKLEANFAGIIEEWDGDRGAFAGAEALLASVWMPTAELTRGDVILATTSREVQMVSGAEFFQGYVRLKVGVVNNTTSVITGVTVDVDFNADVLRLHKIEPTGYRVSGTKVLLGVLNTGEKATVAFYFDPQICTSSMIDGLCRYKDSDGKVHTVSMKSRSAEVVCPIFFTKEQANTAMLRRLVETELHQFDLKAYGVSEGAPDAPLHELFEAMKAVVLAHDVLIVRTFERGEPFEAEAWFYGKTQKGYQMAIRVLVDGAKGRAEFFAASNAIKSVTGLLAEFHHQFGEAAVRRFSELGLKPLFDEALRASYESPQAVGQLITGEINAGETEQPDQGDG